MKVWKKLQVVFLALLLCTGMMTQPALAASLLQDGIEAALTTDKETYQQGEEIKVTLTVTNTNDTAVTNLSLENILLRFHFLAFHYLSDSFCHLQKDFPYFHHPSCHLMLLPYKPLST